MRATSSSRSLHTVGAASPTSPSPSWGKICSSLEYPTYSAMTDLKPRRVRNKSLPLRMLSIQELFADSRSPRVGEDRLVSSKPDLGPFRSRSSIFWSHCPKVPGFKARTKYRTPFMTRRWETHAKPSLPFFYSGTSIGIQLLNTRREDWMTSVDCPEPDDSQRHL